MYPSPIPLLDLTAQHAELREEVLQIVTQVIDAQAFILGEEVASFEREVTESLSSRHAVACASGTDALILALKALDVGPGDEVLLPPFTFFATAGAVCNVGARPVFVDIEPDGFNLDVAKIEARLTNATKAIIPVHLFGQCAEMDALQDLARRYGIRVIEDAAQAIGATFDNRAAGTLGDAGALSFYPTKNLGGYGDGGMVLVQDASLAEKIRLLGMHGDTGNYSHQIVGTNSRLDALQAAVLRIKLKRLGQWNALRKQRADDYRRLLADTPVTPPVELPKRRHVYHLYVIRAPRRDELMKDLAEHRIGCRVYYPKPLHLQECFRDLGYRQGDFPVAEQACREVLALPLYPELKPEDQQRVAEAIHQFYKTA